MPKKEKIVSVFWNDARLYCFKKGEKESLTQTRCIGELVEDNEEFVVLKNCQQFVFDKKEKKYILKRNANFFFIPKGMTIDIR